VRFGSRFPTGSGSLVFRDLGMARLVMPTLTTVYVAVMEPTAFVVI
jgi:hypothetical protein